MALSDQIESDAHSVFLNTNDFGQSVTYTPEAGGAKTIVAIIGELMDPVDLESMAKDRYRMRELWISSVDNTNGHVAPLRYAIDGGAGDSVTLPDATVWYVKDILEEGANSGSGMHKLLIIEKKLPTYQR